VTSFIENPRKALRLPLQCGTELDTSAGTGWCFTENVSTLGCRLVTAHQVPVGAALRVRITGPRAVALLEADARVVWASGDQPWRLGARFDETGRAAAARWLDAVAAEDLELLHHERVPDRLDLTTRLYVTPPPAEAPALGDEEEAVLRLACQQPTVGDLRGRLGPDWSRAQRALFALLTRGMLTLDAAEAGDPGGWRRLLRVGPLSEAAREQAR